MKTDPVLTQREVLIIRAVSHGWSTARLAKSLDCSASYLANQLGVIYLKLGAANRAHAAATAIRKGIIK